MNEETIRTLADVGLNRLESLIYLHLTREPSVTGQPPGVVRCRQAERTLEAAAAPGRTGRARGAPSSWEGKSMASTWPLASRA